MIENHAADIAVQMGLQLSRVSFMGGQSVGDLDVFILSLEAGGHHVSTLIHQSELDGLENGTDREQLDEKIRSALSRLQLLLEP